jgi:putative oxygen-independent coproporphyrinogen III oxidase
MSPFSLYIHIPYCARKCPYCDFNTYAVASIPERDYVACILAELDYYAAQNHWSGRPLRSIFFGGGTPSLFSPRSIQRIIDAAIHHFPLSVSLEVTLEMNPRTELDFFHGLRVTGVNRLSVGAQSFHGALLHALGRDHSVQDIENCVKHARDAGFENISLDLMFGIPQQSLLELESDLAQAVSLAPDHISTYALTLERGTPFYRSYEKGHLNVPDDDTVGEMIEFVATRLPELGYYRYEISNFSLPGKESLHNLSYWNGNDYLGLGAGAHSLCRQESSLCRRWANLASPEEYMRQASAKGAATAWVDTLSPSDQMFEFFFLGLRRARGVSLDLFAKRFGVPAEDVYPGAIEMLCQNKLLVKEDGMLRCTERGFRLSDSVFEYFVVDRDTRSRGRGLCSKLASSS